MRTLPPFDDRRSCFIIAPRAIPSLIRIGSERAAFFSQRTRDQLGEEIVAFFICLADDLSQRCAFHISEFRCFLWTEFLRDGSPGVAAVRLSVDMNAARDECLLEKRSGS